MKIDDLKDKLIKCIKTSGGFEIKYPDLTPIEAALIFKDKIIRVIDVTDRYIIVAGIMFHGTIKVKKSDLKEHFVLADTDERIE